MHETSKEMLQVASIQELTDHLLDLLYTTFVKCRRIVSQPPEATPPNGIAPIFVAMQLVSSAAAFYHECNIPDVQRKSFNDENDRIISSIPHDDNTFHQLQLKNIQVLTLRTLVSICHAASDKDADIEKVAKSDRVVNLKETIQRISDNEMPPIHGDESDQEFGASIPHVEFTTNEGREVLLDARIQLAFHTVKRIFDILIHSIDTSVTDVTQLTGIINILQEFDRCKGYDVIGKVVARMVDEITVKRGVSNSQQHIEHKTTILSLKKGQEKLYVERKLIPLFKSLEELLRLIKQLKADYMHKIRCRRRCHRHCDLSVLLHQHHDILGIDISKSVSELLSPVTTPVKNSAPKWSFGPLRGSESPKMKSKSKQRRKENIGIPSPCVIGRALHFLVLKVLPKSSNGVRLVMTTVDRIGICHCVRPSTFVYPFLSSIKKVDHATQDAVLATLGRALLQRMIAGRKEKSTRVDDDMIQPSYELSLKLSTLNSRMFGSESATCDTENCNPSSSAREASTSRTKDTTSSHRNNAINFKDILKENEDLVWLCIASYKDLLVSGLSDELDLLGLPSARSPSLPVRVSEHLLSIAVHFGSKVLSMLITTVLLPVLRYATGDTFLPEHASIPKNSSSEEVDSNVPCMSKGDGGSPNLHPQILLNCLEILHCALGKNAELRKVFICHSGIELLTKVNILSIEYHSAFPRGHGKSLCHVVLSCLAVLLRNSTILTSDVKVLSLQGDSGQVERSGSKESSPRVKRRNQESSHESTGMFSNLIKGIVRSPKAQRRFPPFRSKSPDRFSRNSCAYFSWTERTINEIDVFTSEVQLFLSQTLKIISSLTKNEDPDFSDSDVGLSDGDELCKANENIRTSSNSTGYQTKSVETASDQSVKDSTDVTDVTFDHNIVTLPIKDLLKMEEISKYCSLISSVIQDNEEVRDEFFKLDSSELLPQILKLITASLIPSEGILDLTMVSSETSSIKSFLQTMEEQDRNAQRFDRSPVKKSETPNESPIKSSPSVKIEQDKIGCEDGDNVNDASELHDIAVQDEFNAILHVKLNLLSSTLAIALLAAKKKHYSDGIDDIMAMLNPLLQRTLLMNTHHCRALCKCLFEAAVKSEIPEMTCPSIGSAMHSLTLQISSPKKPPANFNCYSLSSFSPDMSKRGRDSLLSVETNSTEQDDTSSIYNMMNDIDFALGSEDDSSSNDGYRGDSESDKPGNQRVDSPTQNDQVSESVGLLVKDSMIVNPEVLPVIFILLGDAGVKLDSLREMKASPSSLIAPRFINKEEYLDIVRWAVSTAISLTRWSHQNFETILNHCDLPLACLRSFRTILQVDSENQKDIRHSILELCLILNKEKMSAEHLRLILSFFNSTQPPVEQLLKFLLMLINFQCPGPSHSIAFPVIGSPSDIPVDDTSDTMQQEVNEAYTLSVWKIAPLRMPIRGNVHWPTSSTGITVSLWLQVGTPESQDTQKQDVIGGWESGNIVVIDIDHSTKNQIHMEHSQDVAPYHHLLSIGTKQTMLQIWLEGGTLIFRICVDPDDGKPVGVLAQTECNGLICTNGEWQHITFTYSENHLPDKTILGKVHIISNCTNERDVILEHNIPKNAKSQRSGDVHENDGLLLFIGHWIKPLYSRLYTEDVLGYKLGVLMLLDDIHFTVRSAFAIYRRGPNINNLTECLVTDTGLENCSSALTSSRIRVSEKVNQIVHPTLRPMSSPPGLACSQNNRFFLLPHSFLISDLAMEEFFIDGNLPSSKNLQEHLVLSFSPADPLIYLFNPSKEKVREPERRGRAFSFFSSSTTTPVKTEEFEPLTLQCHRKLVRKLVQVESQWNCGLHRSLNQVGGMQVFLMLCAKVVEVTSLTIDSFTPSEDRRRAERIQSLALEALLQLRATDSKRQQEFSVGNVASLLHKLLTKPRAYIGFHALQILLNTACSGDDVIINVVEGNEPLDHHFEVNVDNSAILHDQEILQVFLLDWEIWHKSVNFNEFRDPDDKFPVWSLLYEGLLNLVQVNHPHQWFNSKSLLRAGAINRILTGLQQMVADGIQPFPDPGITSKMMELLRSLIGSPPDVSILCNICDFLVATHPPASTFVCHSSSSFYFNLRRGKNSKRDVDSQIKVSSKRPSLNRSASEPAQISAQQIVTEALSSRVSRAAEKDRLDKDNLRPTIENSKDFEGDEISRGHKSGSGTASTSSDTLTQSENSGQTTANNSCSSWEDVPHLSKSILLSPKQRKGIRSGDQTPNSDCMIDELYSVAREEAMSRMSSSKSSLRSQTLSNQDLEDELSYVTCELLKLLFMAVMTMPDVNAFELTAGPACAKALVVGVHHRSSNVRAATLRMLAAYFSRCSEQSQNDFLREKGFHLVSNQIHRHNATRPVVDACLYFLLGHRASSEEVLPLDGSAPDPGLLPTPAPNPFSNHAVVLLLSALSRTIHDAKLCKDLLSRLLELFECMGPIADVMLDNGLTLALCNLLTKVLGSSCPLDDNEKEIILDELQHFMTCIAVKSCLTTGSAHFQVFEDLFILLNIVEYDRSNRLPRASGRIARLSFNILMKVIELMQKSSSGKSPSVPRRQSTRTPHFGSSVVRSERITGIDGLLNPQSTSEWDNGGFTPEFRSSMSYDSDRKGSSNRASTNPKARITRQSTSVTNESVSGSKSFRHHGGSLRTKSYKGSQRRRINEAESARRLQHVIVITVDKLSFSGNLNEGNPDAVADSSKLEQSNNDVFIQEQIETYESHLFNTLINWLELTIPTNTRTSGRRGRLSQSTLSVPGLSEIWIRILNISRDSILDQVLRLFLHFLSPWQPDLKVRMLPLYIAQKQNAERMISFLFPKDSRQKDKVRVYLYQLLLQFKQQMTSDEKKAFKGFCRLFLKCGGNLYPMPQLNNGSPSEKIPDKDARVSVTDEIEKSMAQFKADRQRDIKHWCELNEEAFNQLRLRTDHLSSVVTQHAMEVTQQVVLRQNLERKKMFAYMKEVVSNDLSVRKQWAGLLEQLAHERAVWYDEERYPKSWQLDATEGPNRERRRLQRCHLNIDEKFMLKRSQQAKQEELKRRDTIHKKMLRMVGGEDSETEENDEHFMKSVTIAYKKPFSFLFDDGHNTSDSITIRTRLQNNERICMVQSCINVTASSETSGEVLIGESCMYFVGDDKISDITLTQAFFGNHEVLVLSWRHEEVTEIHKRWWQLQDIAIEIFLTNGKTYILAFNSVKDRDVIVKKLKDLNLPNLIAYDSSLENLTQIWRSGGMTNFEYLTQLNKAAGRSFNDLMQYPVMPFILADYTSSILDLNNVETYRNLLRPISVPDDTRMKHYQERYRILEEEFKNCREDERELRTEPFHYGSHYSNSGTVLHFLVRLPPYTQMFLEYQDSSFDIPDRTFHSMETTFRLSCYSSTTDVKELIPEFFFLPEFLCNLEGFDFGFRQCGLRVNHVTLPSWCKADPRLFILIHRQALESDYVSANLHGWIDLVFGFKQTGKAAIEAVNVFHPATYFGMDVSSVDDPVKRKALETMIKTYGQTPKQLFTNPHPAKNFKSEMKDQVPQGRANNGNRRSSLVPPGNSAPRRHSMLNRESNRSSQSSLGKSDIPTFSLPQRPLASVLGLKWGKYLGSPSCPEPMPFLVKNLCDQVGALIPLQTNDVCALASKMGLLVIYNHERGVRSYKSIDIKWSAVLTYGHPDNIVRLKMKKVLPEINLFQTSADDKVTCCVVGPDCRVIILGHRSGAIAVMKCNPLIEKAYDLEFLQGTTLYGHYEEITCLVTCGEFRVLASGSHDGTVILWDLDSLSYIRSLTGHATAVSAIAISRTSGDICTVCNSGNSAGSHIRLWTINGGLLAAVDPKHRVQCVAFSSAPEGISVNVVAVGLSNGSVRLYSSWDLTPIRDMVSPITQSPITCVAFNHNSEVLYAADEDRRIIGWCFKDRNEDKQPTLISFLNVNENVS